MFFVLPNRLMYSVDEKERLIRQIACERVASCRVSSSMRPLDAYLREECGQGLKAICLRLIRQKTNITNDPIEGNFYVRFADEESDSLAKLITYGNASVKGCRLLTFAFEQDY